jgi:hypothetical protein
MRFGKDIMTNNSASICRHTAISQIEITLILPFDLHVIAGTIDDDVVFY